MPAVGGHTPVPRPPTASRKSSSAVFASRRLFLILAGLLLLTLSPSCLPTHHAGTAGGAHPATSATVHLELAGTDASCTAFEPQSVARRSGADGPRLGDGQAIPDAASGGQGDVAGLPDRTAVTGVAVLPHGWTLLLLLAIARE